MNRMPEKNSMFREYGPFILLIVIMALIASCAPSQEPANDNTRFAARCIDKSGDWKDTDYFCRELARKESGV